MYIEESRQPLWCSGQSYWLQNGDVSCFLWGTNWIYVCYVEESRQPVWYSGQSSWLQNGDVLCFLWATNWIYICYVEESRQPLWCSGQSSWLQNGDVVWDTNWIYTYIVNDSSWESFFNNVFVVRISFSWSSSAATHKGGAAVVCLLCICTWHYVVTRLTFY
jgi:hypothetical protein